LVNRGCSFEKARGVLCRAPARRGESFCFWHAPDTAEEAAEARRLGGLHRRKKKTVATIYGFIGLRTVEDNQALLETAVTETFALENSIARNRTLIAAATTGAKLVEVGGHEERIAALESITAARRRAADDDEDDDL
jgi:hypothetical protein